LIRYADLVLLALALPVFLLAGLPMLGYAVVAAAWLVQRAVLFAADRRVAASLAAGERRTAVGVTAASALGRVWFVVICVLLVGVLGEREDGLAAAVLAAILFTAQMVGIALSRMQSAGAVE
jgi:succinate-acetate transporter protein